MICDSMFAPGLGDEIADARVCVGRWVLADAQLEAREEKIRTLESRDVVRDIDELVIDGETEAEADIDHRRGYWYSTA